MDKPFSSSFPSFLAREFDDSQIVTVNRFSDNVARYRPDAFFMKSASEKYRRRIAQQTERIRQREAQVTELKAMEGEAHASAGQVAKELNSAST